MKNMVYCLPGVFEEKRNMINEGYFWYEFEGTRDISIFIRNFDITFSTKQ